MKDISFSRNLRFLPLLFLGFWTASCRKEPASNANVTAELVAEVKSIRPGEPFWAGLRLTMKPGWHTYWKNPGESGMATALEWELPRGFTAEPLQWPAPKKFEDPSGVSYGYEREVLLMARITPPADVSTAVDIPLTANARWLECADVCLPGKARLDLKLPVKSGEPEPDPRSAPLFSATRAKLPSSGQGWLFKAEKAKDRIALFALPPSGARISVRSMVFFPEDHDTVADAAPQIFSLRKGRPALELAQAPSFSDRSLKGVLVVMPEESAGTRPKIFAIDTVIQKGRP